MGMNASGRPRPDTLIDGESSVMIEVDGSEGEGGGQVLRTALALSCRFGTPFRITKIRAKRKKPGLMRQHLTAVLAAAQISNAKLSGAEVGSLSLEFIPGQVRGGEYRFAVGTAGSTMLVLQTVLPPLMLASTPSRLILEGGTHNSFAPPFDYVQQVLLPLVKRMGPIVTATLRRYGFYPAGGGEVEVEIHPCSELAPLQLETRGAILTTDAYAIVASLPANIAQRELDVLRAAFSWPDDSFHLQTTNNSVGPGNIVYTQIVGEHSAEVISGFGEKGVSAEAVAKRVAHATRHYLAADVPVGEHLADQLLVLYALAGSGSFVTMPPSSHAVTNMTTIEKFVDVHFVTEKLGEGRWRISVEKGR